MRTLRMLSLVILALGLLTGSNADAQKKAKKTKKIPPGVVELAIGSEAPKFILIGTDDKMHSYDDLKGKKGTLVIFTCNHCPFAVAYEDRLIALAKEFQARGVGVVAISNNDAEVFADDGFAEMKVRAKDKGFNFPYLYDESQAVALQYGPMVTPHIFLFDAKNILSYRGRIDDSAKEKKVESRELRDALSALVAGKKIAVSETTAFGCSIKWKADVLKTGKPATVAKGS